MVSNGTATVTLPSDTEILITRAFDAPRELVWKAFTTPELVSKWWPGRRGEMRSCEIDLRPGGAWRYVMVASGGYEVAFHGEYHEVVEFERIVNTEVYEGAPGSPAVVTNTFEEDAGRTLLTMVTVVESREVRDAIIESGMEGGMQEGMDLLEELAVSLR
ncbi:MAG TPA: SRPBCC family protein [Solirubrobacter sp.]|nr:SRPBCC family protein [Solirubrobacter sp.]